LEATFDALNAQPARPLGTLTSEAILGYHATYPSLSVGDVVVVDGQAFAVEGWGYKPVALPVGARPAYTLGVTHAARVIAEASKNWRGPTLEAAQIQQLAFLLARDAGLRHAWSDVTSRENNRVTLEIQEGLDAARSEH
jgi:hypothetical protein